MSPALVSVWTGGHGNRECTALHLYYHHSSATCLSFVIKSQIQYLDSDHDRRPSNAQLSSEHDRFHAIK